MVAKVRAEQVIFEDEQRCRQLAHVARLPMNVAKEIGDREASTPLQHRHVAVCPACWSD